MFMKVGMCVCVFKRETEKGEREKNYVDGEV